MKKTIADFSELVKQWHPTKNGDLKPNMIIAGRGRKVWWKCPVADDHEWFGCNFSGYTNVKNGCPCCSGHKLVLSTSLKVKYPELAKQWHPTKNGDLTPYMVGKQSNKKVWWKCSVADDHEWQSTISNRVNGNCCPCCSGHKAVLSNCLMTINPKIAKQWHPTKNENLSPKMVTVGSDKKVWWQCPIVSDHIWQSTVWERTIGHGCSCCDGRTVVLSNCLATTHPELCKEWHFINKLTPYDVTFASHKKIWWKCSIADDHEWKTTVSHRTKTNGTGCPCCVGQKVVTSNCLATTHPELCKEWHPVKNGDLTFYMVGKGSNKKIWWKCFANHEWKTTPNDRTNRGCPICSESKGEKNVAKILVELNLKFKRQCKFKSCKNLNLLPFDFIVKIKNKIKAIEYQGEQHFFPIKYFGGKETLEKIKKHDLIKSNWCGEKNIPLLAIPYWHFKNMEEIIIEFLKS